MPGAKFGQLMERAKPSEGAPLASRTVRQAVVTSRESRTMIPIIHFFTGLDGGTLAAWGGKALRTI
jgi:hypothetical protein